MKILVFTNLYPNTLNPNFGVFIRNRTLALSKVPGVKIKVVSPVPWFPPLKISEKWYLFSQIPKHEVIDGIDVYHPRYLVTPKVGMALYGFWMFLCVQGLIRRLRKNFQFDLIDAHFLYPDGYAACMLGEKFKCPVCLTARGSDVTSYLEMPSIKKLISTAFSKTSLLITVSQSLGNIMVKHGADAEKVEVVSNGIDPERFYPQPMSAARGKLDLEKEERLILTVCSLVELKGVDFLIRAMALLQQPAKLLIVGTGPEESKLRQLVDEYDLGERVIFVGSVENERLVDWYNAADLFFLGSSREGWPNVVCEALACGTPVVATAVNGIPEILDSDELGIMVDRTPEAFAEGIKLALNREWDRKKIAERGQKRTWQNVAAEVHELFSKVIVDAKD